MSVHSDIIRYYKKLVIFKNKTTNRFRCCIVYHLKCEVSKLLHRELSRAIEERNGAFPLKYYLLACIVTVKFELLSPGSLHSKFNSLPNRLYSKEYKNTITTWVGTEQSGVEILIKNFLQPARSRHSKGFPFHTHAADTWRTTPD